MSTLRSEGDNIHVRAPRLDRRQRSRVLVTGASGFVGSQVVRAALDRGDEVVAAVRSRSRAARLEGLTKDIRIVEADLNDVGSIEKLTSEAAPDIALHLAWPLGPDYNSPDNLACVGGSLALLQCLVERRCPRIVFVGTHYELAPSETDLGENDPVAPANFYAVCKDAVHRVARSYVAGAEASFVWARLFNVYGPGQNDWALVSYIVRSLLDGRVCRLTLGDQVRAFLHVRDAADALLDIGHAPIRGVIHVGSDEITTVRDLALRIAEQLGRPELLSFGELAPRPEEARRIVPSVARLHSEVGFRPKLSLNEGLMDTVDWWRKRTAGIHMESDIGVTHEVS